LHDRRRRLDQGVHARPQLFRSPLRENRILLKR
jgi:hypothetical protein